MCRLHVKTPSFYLRVSKELGQVSEGVLKPIPSSYRGAERTVHISMVRARDNTESRGEVTQELELYSSF